MFEFVIHYWIEFLFGLVVAAGGFLVKRTLKSYKIEREKEQEKILSQIRTEIRSETANSDKKDKEIQDEIKILKSGILTIMRRTFEEDCKEYLHDYYDITLEEYNQITKDHEVYKSLGGNHNGDQLFELVKTKVEKSWTGGT